MAVYRVEVSVDEEAFREMMLDNGYDEDDSIEYALENEFVWLEESHIYLRTLEKLEGEDNND